MSSLSTVKLLLFSTILMPGIIQNNIKINVVQHKIISKSAAMLAIAAPFPSFVAYFYSYYTI